MIASEIIRKAIPDADDELCEFVLWARTPFPAGNVTTRDLYRAARRLDRAHKNNRKLCEFCDRIAAPNLWTCLHCDAALTSCKTR